MGMTKLLYGGLKSFLPQAAYSMSAYPVDARYGYAVWLRHLVTLARHGITGPFATVVELGPGNSIATGVSALLCGTDRYIGLDVLNHLATGAHAGVVEEILQLFQAGAPIPGASDFPTLCPVLDDYAFPAWALGERGSQACMDAGRLDAIRASARSLDAGAASDGPLDYKAPWGPGSLPDNSVDLIFTQAVLQEIPHEHASVLREAIETMACWLRPGGVVSHQIDFRLYGLEPWNIHWSWSGLEWTLIRGRRDNFVNREPLSTYTRLLEASGLTIVAMNCLEEDGIPAAQMTSRYRALPEQERRTRAVNLIAVKN